MTLYDCCRFSVATTHLQLKAKHSMQMQTDEHQAGHHGRLCTAWTKQCDAKRQEISESRTSKHFTSSVCLIQFVACTYIYLAHVEIHCMWMCDCPGSFPGLPHNIASVTNQIPETASVCVNTCALQYMVSALTWKCPGSVADEKFKLLLKCCSRSYLDMYPLIMTVFAVPCSPISRTACAQWSVDMSYHVSNITHSHRHNIIVQGGKVVANSSHILWMQINCASVLLVLLLKFVV